LACTGPSTGHAPPPDPREPITLTVGVPQSRQINPAHGVPGLASTLAFERLSTSSAEGHPQARLLKSWSVSGDGLTWRLLLRPGVKFQDGSPLTSDDVKRTFDAAISDPNSRNLTVCLPNVASISAASDSEVVFTLTRRCSYLLDDLDSPISRTAADGKTRLGTGAFSIASSSDDGVTLEANRYYYGGPPAIDRVVVKPFDALRTAWAGMMRGQVDFLWEVGPETSEFLSGRSTVDVRSFLGFYAYSLMLNSARPPFRKAEVRRAFDMAVDRAVIVQQALKGRGVAADGPVWPRYWARDPRAPAAAFNPAESRRPAARRTPGTNRVHVPRARELLDPRAHGAARAAAAWRDRRPHAAGVAAVRRSQPAHRLGPVRRGDDLDSRRALRHGLPPFLALGGRDEALELLGLPQRPRGRGARLGARLRQRQRIRRGHPEVRSGGARRSAGGLPRLEPDGAGCEPPLRRAGGRRRPRRDLRAQPLVAAPARSAAR